MCSGSEQVSEKSFVKTRLRVTELDLSGVAKSFRRVAAMLLANLSIRGAKKFQRHLFLKDGSCSQQQVQTAI